ncbi:hypothetical protein P8452_13391 [Trifolium repens]|nr:hypothetical protein P8452_13391 [Trifolium repens]
MEAVSTKMLRILVGMAGLQIQSTVIKEHDKSQQNPIQDDDWVSVGKPDETVDETDRKANGTKVYEELEDMTKGSNLYEVLQAVTNNFKLHQDVEGERNIDGKLHKTSIPRVANLPVLTRISTVLFGDDGQYETYDYIKFASVLISENQVDNKTLKQLDKGKTQMVPFGIAKKLSFTPSPTTFKRQKKETPVGNGSGKSCMTYSPLMSRQAIRPNATQRRQRNYKFKTVEAILPKYVKCNFRPTDQMHLSKEDAILCAYMFRDDPTTKSV